MTKYILTTIAWVESIAKKEVEKVGWKITEVRDRMIEFEWDSHTMVRLNLWSRVWNKVYQVLWESENIDDFDKLYDLIQTIDFKKYFHHNYPIVVKTKSIKSDLDSVPAIQKIWKKSIIDTLNNKSWEFILEDNDLERFEIMILLIDNKARILLNTTWDALHKRWYRVWSWEAPIKESLAAAIILLSWWRFRETFYDFFCWRWTIAIEASMIAKNIAPWLNRHFAFEKLLLVDSTLLKKEILEAKNKQFEGDYKIVASDIDKDLLDIAISNASKAWVADMINFEISDFYDFLGDKLAWTFVSNPPYWLRLKDEDIDKLYKNIDKIFRINPDLKGWIITSFFDFDNLVNLKNYKKRKLYNWWELCYFYKRK